MECKVIYSTCILSACRKTVTIISIFVIQFSPMVNLIVIIIFYIQNKSFTLQHRLLKNSISKRKTWEDFGEAIEILGGLSC